MAIEMSRYCIPYTPFRGPLEDSTIMLVSTAAVHHKDDPPFNTDGDTSFRTIPGAARSGDLRVADTHYDHGCIDADLNCVFPIDRLYELAEERRIRAVAETHFSLGFTQALRELRDDTIPKLVREVERVRPDAVLLTGG
jgi:hypothetical protein